MMERMHEDHPIETLSAFLDDELDAVTAARVARHLESCDACRDTLAGLARVRDAARSLPEREPPEHVWQAIRSATFARDADVIDLSRRREARARRFTFTLPQLAVAALALMLLSGGGVWVAFHRTGTVPAQAAAAPESDVRNVALNPRPEMDIDRAVSDLETLLRDGRSRLSPQTIATIEANLKIVDAAIEDARAALEKDPNSEYLNQYLAESMQRKLTILRQSTAILRAST